ncbi:hypothetical protein AB0D57_27400 [Streptomyces sp. NPDC048275]|uniref:hypothetical protein n=1 Tax=Streptomyces sp. NPDC048275 TaxID=3155629 RepID=UPI0033BFE987
MLNHLASESAFRIRAGNRAPLTPAAHLRQTTTALTRAAEPVSTALRDLGAAVACLGRADACRHRPAGPARERALAFAQEGLVWTIGNARQRLVHAATVLRTAAVPRAAAPVRRPQQAKGRAR